MGDRRGIAGTQDASRGGSGAAVLDDALRTRVEAWRAQDPDETTRAELTALLEAATGAADGAPDGPAAEAVRELRDRFDGRLAFGTAGLRAPMGAGPRRMNRLVVRQVAAGLARWLVERAAGAGAAGDPRTRPGRNGPAPAPAAAVNGAVNGSYQAPDDRTVTVVVGWDARHRSVDFAGDIAGVLAAAGLRALLLPTALPTPVLAFAVRHLGADAGVMCTASHNPPADNGCKVYLADGAQIVAPDDTDLAATIDGIAARGAPVPVAPPDHPGIVRLDRSVVDAYVEHVAALDVGAPAGPGGGGELTVVYTPLHGVAGETALTVLRRAGFTGVRVVARQAAPDPDFPTTRQPDPEDPRALDLAVAEAGRIGADLVLANDPDGDRLGVAVPARAGGWRNLTGNEIGTLLCEHVLGHGAGDDRLVVSTVVSTRLLGAIARHHGVHHVEVLTGFKWIVRPALAHPGRRFVFGFEEALGFSVDAAVRDKDGIAAALAVAAMVARLRAGGRTVEDELERLSRRHGHHASRTWSVRLAGPGAGERRRALMDRWRSRPPAVLAGRPVVSTWDLAAGAGDLPPADAVVLTCDDGARVVVRPSGTEPKVKVYVEVVVPVPEGADGYRRAVAAGEEAVEELRRAVAAELGVEG